MGYRGARAVRKALWDIEGLSPSLRFQLQLQDHHVSRNLQLSECRRMPHDVTVNTLRCLSASKANKNIAKRTVTNFRMCLCFTTRVFRRRTGRKPRSSLRHRRSCLRYRPLRAHLSSFPGSPELRRWRGIWPRLSLAIGAGFGRYR